MSALSPRQMFLLDEACRPLRQAFGTAPYLVGTAGTRGPYRDVDVRLMLDNVPYGQLEKLGPAMIPFLGLAIGESLAARTGLPIDFQIQRTAEANAAHTGPRNPLGVRTLANYSGDASSLKDSLRRTTMASEWTGCDTGTCVQYRTVDGKVFVRNGGTENISDDGNILQFTAAEWETFVGGLTAEAQAKCQRMLELAGLRGTERDRLAAESGSWRRTAERLQRELNEATSALLELAPSSLAAENARLRQQVATAEESLLDSSARLSSVEDERDRLTAALDRTVLERDTTQRRYLEVVAELAVLRHRDRRTQAVVEAAAAWRAMVAATGERGIRIEGGLLVDAVDALENGPSAPPEAPQSADQTQVVPESNPGPETLGEAQRAIRRGWPRCPDCGATFDGEGLDEHRELGTCPKHADGVLQPRVWNAGDPEPEGVEKVVDREDSPWQRAADGTWWCGPYAVVPLGGNSWEHALKWAPLTEVLPEPVPKIHVCRQGCPQHHPATGGIISPGMPFAEGPDPVEHWTPSTTTTPWANKGTGGVKVTMDGPVVVGDQILGEFDDGAQVEYREPDGHYPPNSGTMVCNKCDGLIWTGDDGWACSCDGAMFEYAKPDGEVPEAGRAGEAQERTECEDCGQRHPVGDEFPERTEGLDAATEAATRAYNAVYIGKPAWNHDFAMRLAVRAASPLIERVALLAAADDWMVDWLAEGTGFPENTDAWLKRRVPQVGGGQ